MIIGIMGNAGVGKSTMANHLVKEYGFVEISFADPMKRFAQEMFDFADAQVWGPSEARNSQDIRYRRKDGEVLTPRYVLQTLGTEWGRNCYPQVWVEYALRTARALLDQNSVRSGYLRYEQKYGLVKTSAFRLTKGVVFSDVRFLNEVEGIKKAHGKVVRLNRPGIVASVGIPGHASEEEQKTIPLKDISGEILVEEGIPKFQASIDVWLKITSDRRATK